MTGTGTPPDRLRAAIGLHAAAQLGHVTRRQLRALGVSDSWVDRAVRRGELRPVPHGRGVFLLNGTPEDWRTELLGACLSVPRGAWVSHAAALRLFGVRPAAVPYLPELVVRGTGPTTRSGKVTVHRTRSLAEQDVTERGPFPVTTPERTVVDLAARLEWYDAVDLVDRLVVERVTTPSRVHRRACRLRRGRRHAALLCKVTGEQGATELWSWLERRAEELLAMAGIRDAEWNVRVPGLPDAGIADTYLRRWGIVIEWHGLSFHRRPDRVRLDHEQRNAVTLANLIPLVFTWYDVATRPGYVIATIRRAIDARTAA